MKDSKLINVIQHFSKPELKRLRNFVHSPYFNTDKKVRLLFDFIYQYAPDFNHEKFIAQYAALFVTPNEKYEEATLIKLQSRLFKVIELFIHYDIEMQHLPGIELSLMRFYNRKNLTTPFKNAHKKVQKKQDEQLHRNGDYYHNQFTIEQEYDSFLTVKVENSTGKMNHQRAMEKLDIFYLAKKLNLLCQMHNRQILVNVNYDMTLMDEILSLLSNSDYTQIPVIALWHQALLLLLNPGDSTYFYGLKKLLLEHRNRLYKFEQRMLYTYLENTSKQIFEDSHQYHQELFKLYDTQLKNELLYMEGFLLPAIFKNIVTVALNLNHLDWTANFLHKNQHKIIPEYEDSEDVYTYCLAGLYFEQKKFDEVLDLLNQVVFNDIYTKMDIRRMYMKVYYEKTINSPFEDMVNSFRKFLNKNQDSIPPAYIQENRDFVNIINKIYNTLKKDQQKLDAIEQQISEIQTLPERAWLLEKLNALR